MAETQLTVKQIVDLGLWEKVCEYKEWNYWILNEGRISEDEVVTFDSEFIKSEYYHSLSEDYQWELKGIIKRLERMSATLYPHSAGNIYKASELLKEYIK